MNYGSLISEAFWLTWSNRFLWFFGFFAGGASFGFNVPSGSGNLGQQDSGSPEENGFGEMGPVPNFDLERWFRWFIDNLALILVIAAAVALIVLVLIALRVLCQGALVDSVVALHRGGTRHFRSTWRAGLSHFWRILALDILLLLISLGFLLMIAVPVGLIFWAIFSSTESVGLIVATVIIGGLLAIGLFILLFVPLTIVGQLALRELVLGDRRIVGSISRGFDLLRRNLGRSLLVWIILVALMLGAGIVLLILGLILGLVLLIPVIALALAAYTIAAIVVGVVVTLIFLIPFVVISGAIGAFGSSYWTLAYLRLTDPAEGTALQHGQGA